MFFDVASDNEPLGRIEMVTYDNVVPKTVKNFKALAKGMRRTVFDMKFCRKRQFIYRRKKIYAK